MFSALLSSLIPLRAGDPDQPRWYVGRHRHPHTWLFPRPARAR